ncbi:MAG TPA: bifunctional protein-serine/threonine kinase/phosphatase, partial [Rhizobiales bacterium]|nr:bifunctional protein-serine/threonine kinase/phosphatase [Hyphomicrobiales bacterium]
MAGKLKISIGQCSLEGAKEINQDFHGALLPSGLSLASKGIAIAIADGISSSSVSQIAAESAIKSFLTDYFCTPDTWTVKTSAQRVISASNSWAYAQTKRSQHAHDMDRGYVCTFSALVLKGRSAHIFHIGDSRIYRLSGAGLEQLTDDHRVVLSSSENYLGRAIGMARNVEIDYHQLNIAKGDIFILATDGVYEHIDDKFFARSVAENTDDLDHAASLIANEAFARGSPDNLTIQIVRIETIPDGDLAEFIDTRHTLPAPPLPEARQEFDGYKIVRQLHGNHRSHIYLARDLETGEKVALKIPSIDLREDETYIKRFLLEEWIARRISNTHVLKPAEQTRPRNFIYVVNEYIKGQTLAQWMIDNPKPDIETVRLIIEQVAKGLRAFHRKEMLHQDLRPDNIMIDQDGTVKIIDFGSARVAGVAEASPVFDREQVPGTLQYAAPEYFIGEPVSRASDFFSLGVIAYQMLTGKLPYGAQAARIKTKAQLRKLSYLSARKNNLQIPDWIDEALRKATHPDPFRRYETLTEFIADLRTPNP